MKLRTCLFIIWLSALSVSAFGQGDSTVLGRAEQSLAGYFNAMPVEKVYLQLDRSYYIPGDTIWFKAYTVIGQQHQLSALSGVLYCELVNAKDSVITPRNLKLLAGLGWGDFELPRSVKPGTYHLRAYTNWMRNAGPGYFYNQEIRIGGPQKAASLPAQTVNSRPDVQFFPEGGQLISDVRSRVAVKCVNSNGFGEDIKGNITDNEGNEVASFFTQHLGMGVFALTPAEGKTYKANITLADSSKYSIDLPAAQPEGFTMAVNSSADDSIYLKVAANDKLFKDKPNSSFYVLAQAGGKVYYTAQSNLLAAVFTSHIPKNIFPSGIVQFTLFSQTGEPLCERVLFIQNNDALKVTLSAAAQTYLPRQKVKMGLAISNGDEKVVTGSFSVSVINESRVPVDEGAEVTILNNLLLTSDLKGYIEKPNYYFINESAQTRADLDLLMLTQGYRRFDWKNILSNKSLLPLYQPEKTLELTGVIKTPGGKPVANGKINLLATKEKFVADTVTDANGNFKFNNLTLSDTARIILRARKQHNGDNVAIFVQQQKYPPVIKSDINTDTAASLSPEMVKNIADYQARLKQDSLKNGRVLQEVKIKAHRDPKPDIYNRYGTTMEFDADMKRFNREWIRLSDALAALIPGANYAGGYISYESHPARLIIDGFSRSGSDIDLYSPQEIDNVRMVSATGISAAKLIVTSKRYAGTDTASTMLKEVVIKDKRVNKRPDLSHSANIHGGGNADQVIMGSDLNGCVNLSDCLTGRIFGASNRNGLFYSTRNSRLTPAPMTVIIDGIMTDGASKMMDELNPEDVYSIEVLRSGAYLAVYGSTAAGGAIIITTRRGGEPGYMTSVDPSGLITYPFKGFYKARTFYSPKYDKPNAVSAPDYRSTIYWNPNIITGKDGKASFEYYNADTKGTYRVVVEGIDDNGKLGRQVYTYRVE